MRRSTLLLLPLWMILPCLGGCGWLAQAVIPEPKTTVQAEFAGLENHSVAIVVYADSDVQYEYPGARLELAARLGGELQSHVKNVRVLDPRRAVRYQDENLDWDVTDKTQLGKAFAVDYVVYLALSRYSMREGGSEYLCRGEIIADVSVHQVSLPERQSRVYTLSNFRVAHPPEAVPADNEAAVAFVRATCEAEFASRLARKFYKHEVPQ